MSVSIVSCRFAVLRRSSVAFCGALLCWFALAAPGVAQPIQKSVINVDAGDTKLSGATFGYRLTYSCNNTSTDCANARVVDLLPAEVQFVDTIPASPGGDVAAINVTPNFGGSGRTQVEFVMVNPLPAGNSGDLLINVRFPNGSTPDGTVATNTADGINLETAPGTLTTPPVDVTAVASANVTLTKTLLTNPALLDQVVTYRLRMSVSGGDGSLNVSGITFSDSLPPGAVFQGSTPAADCQPACVGTVAPALNWSGPFSINAGSSFDIQVNVIFPSATFADGESVTNSFTTTGTPLGESPDTYGPGSRTHPVEVFTPDPDVSLQKRLAGPIPPTFGQTFDWQLDPRNSGNVPVDDFVVIDTLPLRVNVINVTSGRYNSPPAGVAVAFETNLSGGFVALGTNASPGTTNDTYPIPVLGAGEYVTRVRWDYGQAPAGMISSSTGNRPVIRSQVINPDNAGNPVMVGDSVLNCADLTAVFDPGGANQPVEDLNNCISFNVAGPYVQFSPNKDRLTLGGPFNIGQTISWRLRVRSNSNSSDPIPLENVVVVDLLPVDLVYTPASFTYNPNGTGLPSPTLEVIENYDATGRTLLRWTWPAASGDLAPNQEPRLEFDTTVRFGASFGTLTNTFAITENDPGLDQRCSAIPDFNDLDGDGDRTDLLCVASESATIAPIAQLVSSKTVQALCDADYTSTSTGTLLGGELDYRMRVQNLGTVPMEDFVLVDILPALGDTGVLDLTPRDSLWTPILVAPVTPPAGTTVYYSTSQNPCRPEVGGPTTGCDAPGWTTVAPAPLTSVRSFKIEFGERVLAPADFLEFSFQLVTPGDTPTGGEQAFNSFAYLAQRSDGLGSLSAEPNKVGTAIGTCDAAELGDFVWVDTNGDGIQNDGATGLDGVYVQLFTPGADGVPRTFDDVPLGATVTGTGPLGESGWYQFPNLAPGSYYVLFHPPPTYAVTLADAGGDDSLDSDIDPTTACSPLVTLGVGESNQTIDAGLLPPALAALGNYVWFDRDGEGDQDESPFYGANGVTVRLYADDGDGIPEPGGDDGAPLRTTATADDEYGRPGYYLFDLLTPGVPYFVEFVLPASATGFTVRDAGVDDTVDSDADVATGLSQVVILAPGEARLDLDAGLIGPVGVLALGDQVWADDDNDGVFEPEDGELGIDGVELSLYRDVNNDGEPTLDEFVASTLTATAGGFAGRYRFDQLDAGDYIVVVELANFAGGGALAGKTSSTGNDPAPDPDDDVDGDDNGTYIGSLLASLPVTLSVGGEPTSEDGDADTNLTVDFGFVDAPLAPNPQYDYGDAPDVVAGTELRDYRTTALDGGAAHLLGVAGAPYLGDCVDADDGTAQNVGATADDLSSFGMVVGTCAVPGDDEDGVTLPSPVTPGSVIAIDVRASTGTQDCVLDAWIDWDADGEFEAAEQIAASLTIPSGTTSTLTPIVPPTTLPGLVYARFRCSAAGGLGPVGLAPDGEVEDYVLSVSGTDFGDAPDSYGTTLAANGARHEVDPLNPFHLGACVDTELDGQPDVDALGDDLGLGTYRVGDCLDDEDGVAFATPPVVCQMSAVTVTANRAGLVDGWIDFYGSGTFDPIDRVFTAQPVVAGINVLPVMVPCDAPPSLVYARFRLSTAGVAGPTGPAADGEVEDYRFALQPAADFGDAPDSYGTTLASDGARHAVTGSSAFLGACVDAEGDAGTPLDGSGDDVTVGPATVSGTCVDDDDEDGVSFDTNLVGCEAGQVTVTASGPALLDAWIDFGADGVFDAGDRIAAGLSVAAGANVVPVAVPCSAVPGPTFARFRLSSAGVAGPTGFAPDGEVEDYAVSVVAQDWGDAPDVYGTTAGSGGPSHHVAPGTSLYLGSCVDTEGDARPPLDATGDDADVSGATVAGTCTATGDEDGVVFSGLTACLPATVTVTAAAGGILDAWIDFGADGSFDASDRIATGLAVAAGATPIGITVPCDAVPGMTYSRFRLSSAGVAGPHGPAADGEVEDHAVILGPAEDFGDAPEPGFPTLLASNGARHVILPIGNPTLGLTVDAELDGQPTPLANGDDVNSSQGIPDDEDGVVFPSVLIPGTDGAVEITAGATGGFVSAWCDLDQNGTWDLGEQIATDLAVAASSTETVTFPVPVGVPDGTAVCRFRIDSAGGLGFAGPAADGEVEDHLAPVGVEDPRLGIAKRLVGEPVWVPGTATVYDVTFHLDAVNYGNVPLHDVQVVATLADAFAQAASFQVLTLTSADFTVNAGFDGDLDASLLAPGETLAVGAQGSLELVVRIDSGGFEGPYVCSALGMALSPADEPVTDVSQDGTDPDPDGDGDPGDDSEPTIFLLPNVLEIPTLDRGGLALLALLLAFLAVWRVTPGRVG